MNALGKLELIAACAMGLEALVARELKELGYTEQRVENGRVVFQGDELAVCRANLWLRTADRILVRMGQFPATTFDELFEGVKALDWPDWIPEDAQFPVEGRSHKSQLSSVPACQGIVKKAVVESLKSKYGTEWFDESGSRYTIEVSLLNDIATITLDTTGPSLHKRGYRKLVTEAPLKETLAAALVLLSRWNPDRPLYDPFCGSGTIPVEAALIGWNVAPGLRREFASDMWDRIAPEQWEQAREEAYDAVRDDVPLDIVGSDLDSAAVEVATAAAKAAGLARELRFRVMPIASAKPSGDYGALITNPPYGERLGDQHEAELALRELGRLYDQLPSWSAFVISPARQLEHYMGRKSDKNRKLFNGRIETHFHQFLGPLPPRK